MEKDHYPEIKIPNEFIVKFEFDKDLPPGTATSGPRELRDEIIIRYLQFQYQRLEEFHEKEMRETEVRMRNKMHGYARACLDTISKDLKKEIRLYFV
jgi:hypothetical protein